MQQIKKAIVAVAGSGTRLLPATRAVPKEMLPLVDKPILQILVEELLLSGIESIFLVTRSDKRAVEEHFLDQFELDGKLSAGHDAGGSPGAKKAHIFYVRQKGPYGNGTPVLSAADCVKDEPFIYAFGDDLVKSSIPFAKQMIDDYSHHGSPMIGVQEVPLEEVVRYGIVKLKDSSMELTDIVEKPSIEETPSRYADFGRMILNQEIVDILKKTAIGKGNELWIVDAIKAYVKNGGRCFAKQVEGGEWLTTGDPLNFIKATLKYGLDRPDIGQGLREFLRTLT